MGGGRNETFYETKTVDGIERTMAGDNGTKEKKNNKNSSERIEKTARTLKLPPRQSCGPPLISSWGRHRLRTQYGTAREALTISEAISESVRRNACDSESIGLIYLDGSVSNGQRARQREIEGAGRRVNYDLKMLMSKTRPDAGWGCGLGCPFGSRATSFGRHGYAMENIRSRPSS